MSDKSSDKKYRITLTEKQLALIGNAVETLMRAGRGQDSGAIENEPGEDVKPVVHAHWIEHRVDNGNVHCKCSYCGKEVSYPYAKKRWKYCIECGAKMDEEENET